jgi:hypothetical protein
MKKLAMFLSAALLPIALAQPAIAEERPQPENTPQEEWQGDIHRFNEYDILRWKNGHWFNGRYEGRRGWWWVVDDAYYSYPDAVYPYPSPYTPEGAVLPPSEGNMPAFVYYCTNPAGYYPYVADCIVPWQKLRP